MGKTVYSLVLTDEVVAVVDAMAAREGYSRSALVDHILAGYVSMATPAQTNRQTIDALRGLCGGLRAGPATGSAITFKTALPYKYNPALSYTVELWGEGEMLGRLRVSLRSQSGALLQSMDSFYRLWQEMETACLPIPPRPDCHAVGAARYQRTLRRPAQARGGDETAGLIARYIGLMDDCLKLFFGAGAGAEARRETKARYANGLATLEEAAEL